MLGLELVAKMAMIAEAGDRTVNPRYRRHSRWVSDRDDGLDLRFAAAAGADEQHHPGHRNQQHP